MRRTGSPTPAMELLEEELALLRGLPYSLWSGLAGTSRVARRRGSDGRVYRVTVDIAHRMPERAAIHVTVTVRSADWLAFRRVRDRLSIPPEGPETGADTFRPTG